MGFFEWNEQQKANVLAAPPCSVDDLFHRDFGVVRGARVLKEESDRTLFATNSYCLFWLEADENGQVHRITCLDADVAEPLFWTYYYAFPTELIEKAKSCFQSGVSVTLAFQAFTQNRLAPPAFKVIDTADGLERREYVLRHFPPLRAAFLHLDVGSDEHIQAMRLLVGEDANTHRAKAGQ